MKNVFRCMALLVLCSSSVVWAGGVVRIADGDCDGLAAAASAAAGQEPTLIVLARNGHYGGCEFTVNGKIILDGAGASMQPAPYGISTIAQFLVAEGASLTMRQLNFTQVTNSASSSDKATKPQIFPPGRPIFLNNGSLVIDTVSVFDVDYGILSASLFTNRGALIARNLVSNASAQTGSDIFRSYGGSISISASTLTNNYPSITDAFDASPNISISNSILAGNAHGCVIKATSLGGNVTDDTSCFDAGPNDRVVSNLHLLEVGTHGGVANTVALRSDSPAVGNGVASLCEATDARGVSRGQTSCDAGAYEFGGGVGKLSETGMSGVFYDSKHDGHYVSVQRLPNETALVIWNTFDENGAQAWLFGVGAVSGQTIHVDQFARNLGGKLLPGGDVVGAHASIWGSVDLTLSDCSNARLDYTSSDPAFGSGSVSLLRVASVQGVDCSL